MKFEEAIKCFDKLEKEIKRNLPRDLISIVASDTVAAIQTRVIERQETAKGSSFDRYSTKPTLSSGTTAKSKRIFSQLAGSKSKRKNLDWVTIKRAGKNIHLFEIKGGYQEIRRLEGFGNTAKSFEFTGQMWRMFGIKKTQTTGSKILITLGGKDQESQDKIDWNSEREGIDIIDMNKDEVNHLIRQVEKEMKKYIKRAGL